MLGVHCSGHACACENCVDDDGDGTIDVGVDPECTSYLDDDEASFGTAIASAARTCRQDCDFDNNAGGGGADCDVPIACVVDIATWNATSGANCPTLPPNPSPSQDCTIDTTCNAGCLPYVPNGCDCFGCCDVVGQDGLTYHVLVGSTCTYAMLQGGSYGSCMQCTPNATCRNDCERCELCIGRTLDELPADCTGTTVPTCGTGVACAGNGAKCADGFVCNFGCCVPPSGG